jgi:NAD(P)H-dependent FMN reductase
MTTTVLLVNGGLRGARGDTAAALAHAARAALALDDVRVDTLVLAEERGAVDDVVARVRNADALVLGTGTVWSGPSSVMTRFLEVLTPLELDAALLGKPAAAVVTMDSVGGVEVGSRLLTSMSLMGCTIPPCALVVLSRATRADADVWSVADLDVLVENIVRAARARTSYVAWPAARARALTGDYPTVGALELGLPRAVDAPRSIAIAQTPYKEPA